MLTSFILLCFLASVANARVRPCKIPEDTYVLQTVDGYKASYSGDNADPTVVLSKWSSKAFKFAVKHSPRVPSHSLFYQTQFQMTNLAPFGSWNQFKGSDIGLGKRVSYFNDQKKMSLLVRDREGVDVIAYCNDTVPVKKRSFKLRLVLPAADGSPHVPENFIGARYHLLSLIRGGYLYSGAAESLAAEFKFKRVSKSDLQVEDTIEDDSNATSTDDDHSNNIITQD